MAGDDRRVKWVIKEHLEGGWRGGCWCRWAERDSAWRGRDFLCRVSVGTPLAHLLRKLTLAPFCACVCVCVWAGDSSLRRRPLTVLQVLDDPGDGLLSRGAHRALRANKRQKKKKVRKRVTGKSRRTKRALPRSWHMVADGMSHLQSCWEVNTSGSK